MFGRFSLALIAALSVLGACGNDETAEQAAATSSSAGANGGGGTGGGAAGAPGCALGSTWSIVDDFVLSPGQHSNPNAIAAGPDGEIYASGVAHDGMMFRGVVRKSVDGGATWNTLDAVDPVDMDPIGGSGIVVDPAGVVYMIGGADGARVVWKSDDGGQTFTRIDEVPIPTTVPCNTGSIARAPDGTLYTLGSCDDTGWIVRRGDNAGASWSTVSTFELAAGHSARSGAVFVDAMGRAFVSGAAQDMIDLNHWIVRSEDAGGMWTTVDDYQLATMAHARTGGLGGSTRLYAVGDAATVLPDFTGSHWIVRTADPMTGAWSTVDDYAPSATATSRAASIYEDPNGALLVFGVVQDDVEAVVTRRSDDGGASWEVVDTYSYVEGKPSGVGDALTSDPAGNVYVMIRGVDANDDAHWIVRKLACD